MGGLKKRFSASGPIIYFIYVLVYVNLFEHNMNEGLFEHDSCKGS